MSEDKDLIIEREDVVLIRVPLVNGGERVFTLRPKVSKDRAHPLFTIEDLKKNPMLLFESEGKIPSAKEMGVEKEKYQELCSNGTAQ